MPVYQEMSEEELQAILSAHGATTELADEQKKEDAFMRQFPCPRCGGEAVPCFSSAKTVFTSGSLVPRLNKQCLACGCEFSPHSGIIAKLGNPGKAIETALAQQTPWLRQLDDEE